VFLKLLCGKHLTYIDPCIPVPLINYSYEIDREEVFLTQERADRIVHYITL
jgi:hypothetical protein